MPTRSKKKSKRVAVKITNFKGKRLRAIKARRVRKARFPKALTDNHVPRRSRSSNRPTATPAIPLQTEGFANSVDRAGDSFRKAEGNVRVGEEFPGSGAYPTYEEYIAVIEQAKRMGLGGVVISFGTVDNRTPQQKLADLQIKIARMIDEQRGLGGTFAAEVAEVVSLFPGTLL